MSRPHEAALLLVPLRGGKGLQHCGSALLSRRWDERNAPQKIAIVIGAGQSAESTVAIGNGQVTALVFAREGARVLAVDRDRAAAEATVKRIAEAGGEAMACAADADEANCITGVALPLDGGAGVRVGSVRMPRMSATQSMGSVPRNLREPGS